MYQSLLEAAGIATHVRNRDLVVMVTEVPIPEFFPALCVVNDGDYDRALEILKAQRDTGGKEAQAEAATEVPYETRGIILAGVVLLCSLLFLFGLTSLVVRLREPASSVGNGVIAAGIMLAAVLIVVRTTRGYLATRKRAAEPESES